MSPIASRLLSGAIAVLAGGITLPTALVAAYAIPLRCGVGERAAWILMILFGVGGSAVLAFEVFRCTFNALCERWSDEPHPPRIGRIGLGSTIVRSLR